MVTISRGRNTRVYISSSLRSSIGPSTRNASFAETCIFVKLAATKASASLHRHISDRQEHHRRDRQERLILRERLDLVAR